MEEKAQEEDSSSQSVNITVVSIDKRGTFDKVTMSDSSFFFIFPDEFLKFNFFEGQIVERDIIKKLEFCNNTCLAYKKAVKILSFAPNTAFMLKRKLFLRKINSAYIDAVLKKLAEQKLIDDKQFAENWIASRLLRNPESPVMLKVALRKKGVDNAIIDEVLKEFTPESNLYKDSFNKTLVKQLKRKNTSPEKIKAALVRKGYSLSYINKHFKGMDKDFYRDN
jgi:regulatory protein